MIKPLSFRFPFLPLLILLICGTLLSQPQINLSTTYVTPRTSLLQYSESTYWNSVVNYSQQLGNRLSVESQFEYGSETGSLPNPFRIYNLTAKLDFGRHQMRLGRIAHWSALTFGRVDGLDYTLSTQNFGSLRLLGGFDAVTDFSDTSFTDKIFILGSWSAGRVGNNVDFSYWMELDGEETNSFIGVSTSKKLFFDIRFTGRLAWSITAEQVYHNKFKLAKRIGNNVLTVGLRQKRYLSDNPYPWVADGINPSPVLNFGVTSRFGRNLVLWNQLNHRLNEEGVSYFRSSALFNKYTITATFSSQGDKTLFGTSIGAKKAVTKNLDFSGSLSLNMLTYGDIVEPSNSIGGYWALCWQPSDKISIRIFTRYFKNPYFKYDSRGGLVINVVL
ncbi:MAG: hypothetical protein H8E14_00970 [Candidatus Marinimicrobia bacterium]|nr:hypothetical protein [Candidatus Neomarinimicrobiota bacterium]